MLIKRPAEPGEIEEAIAFLSTSEPGFITGATIDVDGGATLD